MSIQKKLIQTPEGDVLITNDKGHPLTCPFQNGILIPGQLQGQIALNRPPCGSQCSLFELSPSEFESKLFLKKHCCEENEKLLPFEKTEKKGNLRL
jgi:hypothetical protein